MSICASCSRPLRGRGRPSAAESCGAAFPREGAVRARCGPGSLQGPGGQACGDFGFPQKRRTELRGAGIGVAGSPRGRGKRMCGRASARGADDGGFSRLRRFVREHGEFSGFAADYSPSRPFSRSRSRGAAFSATHHTFLQRGPCPAYLFRSGESCTREPRLPQHAAPQGPCVASRGAWPRRGRLLPCLKGMTTMMHRYLLFCRRRRYFAGNESFWENRRYGNNRRQDV